MNTDKVLDDAREKILGEIGNRCLNNLDHPCSCEPHYREQCWGKVADQILALSGTTDIECKKCDGEGHDLDIREFICHQCSGTGVIKHKWKVSVTLENGELPENNYTVPDLRLGYQFAQRDMGTSGWVKEVRQVVE